VFEVTLRERRTRAILPRAHRFAGVEEGAHYPFGCHLPFRDGAVGRVGEQVHGAVIDLVGVEGQELENLFLLFDPPHLERQQCGQGPTGGAKADEVPDGKHNKTNGVVAQQPQQKHRRRLFMRLVMVSVSLLSRSR